MIGVFRWLFRITLGVIALVAADEPSLSPTTGRHADVGWFQRTALGLALTYRRGWVPMKAQPWVWPVVVGLLVAPGAALGWHEVGAPAGLGAAANFAGFVLASPVAVLAAGVVAENDDHGAAWHGVAVFADSERRRLEATGIVSGRGGRHAAAVASASSLRACES